MTVHFNQPMLELQSPFSSEKFRKVAANMQEQADDMFAAIAELIAIADAMDGASQMAAKTNVDKLMTGLDRGMLAKLAADETRETLVMDPAALSKAPEPTPLNAAEAFATPPPVPTPPVPTTAAPPPPPPVPAADAETDDKGNPWIEGVHADNKSKKQDGTWKARRGGTKSPATNRADGGPAIDDVDLKTFQAAMGKLIAVGVDLNMITESVSQTVFNDMSRHTGGIEHVLATDDAKLTGGAWSALKAIALQTGNGSAF